jgi:leader peptidase (prepilin peptidase)/N-methyltransferase
LIDFLDNLGHRGLMNVLSTATFTLAGIAMGTAGRLLLARLTRGVVLRPPWCELASGAASAVLGWRSTALPWWWLPVPLLLTWLAVPLAAADLTRRRLPNALTLPAYPVLGMAIALAATCGPDPGLGPRAAIGILVFGGAHAVVRMVAPTALGTGDVKLAGSLGAVLGALGWPALVLAAALAAVITLLLAVGRRRATAPHGPGLLLATWLVATFPGGVG